MNALLRNTLAVTAVAMAAHASAQVTFYEQNDFQGQSFTTSRTVDDLARRGFNDRASSAVVAGERWEVCEDARFDGRCVVLRPGRYPSLNAMGLNDRVSSVRAVSRNARVDDQRYAPAPVMAPAPMSAQITFYENEGLSGRSFTTNQLVNNLNRFGFNDRASSAVVVGDRWEVCEDVRFRGQCVVLRQGTYGSLRAMGLNNRVSSVRALERNTRIDDRRYAPAPVMAPPPAPVAAPEFRPRRDERLFEANVTSVRAVVGPPEQRCWIEREQVAQTQNNSVPGALAGALLGGILGHQIGDGTGKDLATAGGAVAGAAIGANVGRNGNTQQAATQDVRRCKDIPSQKPQYWDVSYNFRGQDHRVQMTTPPGPTVTVNAQGEPRAN